ncbi:unnamed protein product [Prunus armeniaca]|uniref:Inhibitor I9 domain-containing protein n=1 Tax=Prunus armeniaca TaxID=36596 RepID=A0A6J5WG74_PRUAR|nr:unnamed protein product [Prunus armeniaca]
MGEKHHHDSEVVTSLHHDMLVSDFGSKEAAYDSMVYSYKHGFSGFAAEVTESQAQKIAEFMPIPFPGGAEASVAYDLLQQPIMQFMERDQKLHQEDHLGYLEHLRHDGNDDVSTYWELAGRYMPALTVEC